MDKENIKDSGMLGESEATFCSEDSIERYRDFIENINDGVYETDAYGNFMYFNNALCKVFGYPREEIQGANFSKFMEKPHTRMAYGAFTKIWVTHQGFTDIIWEVIDKEGKTRTIELSAHLITDKNGKKLGFRGIARDVTEMFKTIKALKESEEHLQKEHEASRIAEERARNMLNFIPYPMLNTTLDGRVLYLNPAFTEVFGWTLEEVRGKPMPFIPENHIRKREETIKRDMKERVSRFETRRLTKDGRILDVIMGVAVYEEKGEKKRRGELAILRDITHEKRMARNNEAMLRISLALPAYPVLEDLMDFISGEVKGLLNTEGAIITLLDEERGELFFQGAAYDDSTAQKRVKEIRFPADKGITGKVIRTGKAIIVPDASEDPDFYPVIDEQLHFHTNNMLTVPLRSSDRTIGVLSALNKKQGDFDQSDVELLSMVAGTVALSIENARFSEEIQRAYREVSSLNRAKDRVINHLSHELKTPISVLLASFNILMKKMEILPQKEWMPTFERADRNLRRILEIQYEVEDIMQEKDYRAYHLLSYLLDQCSDTLQALVAEETGEAPIVKRIGERIEELFGPKESEISEIRLDTFVERRITELKPKFSHRQVRIHKYLEKTAPVCIPYEVLRKVVDGIIRNAVENTPDGGKIDITVKVRGEGTQLEIHDFGIGITKEDQVRIFEGFFSTQETMDYSSKRPFDFNAGGKGADLLRMKIFSERYHFKIDMESSRCQFIPKDGDRCPGKISECGFCTKDDDCYHSGGTVFRLFFPSAPKPGCAIPSEGAG